ncbi:MAG: tRNA uridine-5-carboxymethylaminomethyl(34) synthesis enzyme MnmG, partial [Mycoplasmataceae bacterium]|nr:tRNA uridine-5-carboxymethylaminomethyl(34) synthesis enzyme MnmG [Mycoplasmataceae bacterium]
LFQLLKRPEVNLTDIISKEKIKGLSIQSIEKIETKIKFEGYLVSQQKTIDKYNKLENFKLDSIKDYKFIKNLSLEAIAKLNKIQPLTLNQAQRIQGITSNDIVSIKYFLDKQK